MLNTGTELARTFARGTLWLWTLQCCSDKRKSLLRARCGVGYRDTTCAAGLRRDDGGVCWASASHKCERWPLARAPTIALCSCSLSPHPARTLPRRAALWSLDPPALYRSLAALTLTPSLFHSPFPLRLSPLPLLPLPPSSLTPLSASLPQISRLHTNPEIAVSVVSQRRERRRFSMQLIVSAGDSSTVTITGKVRRRSLQRFVGSCGWG